ncbi:alpha/beta fold hydrolase [Acanthopleuribacter pedis]|uniref:Alpha/beta hydrolase n=1 Tax=Acanthopleuribacter pedis TaxID=442870 RepID=A0A8J7Q8Q7_9BACT|nr:alpha/beta hydrolase [Acanthopleuribacter pedis]MBO1318979.1 alpha/beta hydrolase [Acanthopleuribacter pedis]
MVFRRKWVKIGVVAGLLLLLSPLIMVNCMSFGPSAKKIQTTFDQAGVTPVRETLTYASGKVHTVATGSADKPLVIFVHGSPGGWHNNLAYLTDEQLLAEAHMVAIDRPGFGLSDRGAVQPSQAVQAAAVAAVIKRYPSPRKAILVGHSLGGPVIARVAMDYPDLVGHLVMVAPSIDPELEKIKWFQYPATWRVLNWMIPIDLLTTNREILPLKGELEHMIPMWPAIQAPTTVFHGTADKLVPYENAEFAKRMMTSAPVNIIKLEDQNHFILWSHHVLIRDHLLATIRGEN